MYFFFLQASTSCSGVSKRNTTWMANRTTLCLQLWYVICLDHECHSICPALGNCSWLFFKSLLGHLPFLKANFLVGNFRNFLCQMERRFFPKSFQTCNLCGRLKMYMVVQWWHRKTTKCRETKISILTGWNGKSEVPLKVIHFFREISVWSVFSICFSTGWTKNFGLMESLPFKPNFQLEISETFWKGLFPVISSADHKTYCM